MKKISKILSLVNIVALVTSLFIVPTEAKAVNKTDLSWSPIWQWDNIISKDNTHVGNCILNGVGDVGITLDSRNTDNSNGFVLSHKSDGTNMDTVNLTKYKETGCLVFDIKLDTEISNPETAFTFKFQSVGWAAHEFRLSAADATAAKSDWTQIEVPLSEMTETNIAWDKMRYIRIIKKQTVDCDIYIKDIGVWAPALEASVTDGVLSWSSMEENATYQVLCSVNGAEQRVVYTGTETSYKIPQNINAVCDYEVKIPTNNISVKVDDVVVRDKYYKKTQSFYGNLKNDSLQKPAGNYSSRYLLWGAHTNTNYGDFKTAPVLEGTSNVTFDFKTERNLNKYVREDNYRLSVNKKETGEWSSEFDISKEAAKNGVISFLMYDESETVSTTDNLWVAITDANNPYKNNNNNSKISGYIKGYPTNQWVMVTIPIRELDAEFNTARMLNFAVGIKDTNEYDHKVHIQSIAMYMPTTDAEKTEQPQGVKSVRFGGGGMVTGVVIANDGTKYVRTDVGGSYRFDENVNEWLQLNDDIQKEHLRQSYYGVAGIGVHPENSNIIYEAVGSYYYWPGAVKKSTDGGKTWKTLTLGSETRFIGNGDEGRNFGECIAVDNDGTVYVGTPYGGLYIIDEDESSVQIPLSDIVPNRDYTATWESPSGYRGIRTVLLDGNYIYLGIDIKEEDGKACVDGVYRLNKDGSNPVKVSGLDSDVRGMTKYGDSIWAVSANDSKIYKTNVSGSFELFTMPSDYTADGSYDKDLNLWSLNNYDKFEKKFVEARDIIKNITSVEYGGKEYLIFATDGSNHYKSKIFCYDGTTWTSAVMAKINGDCTNMTWREGDKDFGTGIKDVAAYANPTTDKLEVYVTTGWGVFKTEDFFADIPQFKADVKGIEEGVTTNMLYVPAIDGTDFGRFFFGAFDFGGAIYKDVDSYDYKYLSRPPGGSLSNHDLGLASGSAYALDNPNIIAVYGYSLYYTDSQGCRGAGSNLSISKDGGDTWEAKLDDYVQYGVTSGALAMSKSGNNIVIIPTNYNRTTTITVKVGENNVTLDPISVMPMYSKDGGETWNTVTGLSADMLKGDWTFGRDYLEADNTDDNKFYALDVQADGTTRTYSVYESTDGGASFTLKNSVAVSNSTSSTYYELKKDPESNNLYISSLDGIYLYNTKTAAITKVDGFTDVYSVSFGKNRYTDRLNVKYVLGTYNGVYGLWKSEDGVNYSNIIDKTKIGLANANKLEADKDSFGRVYISTDGRGILYTAPDDWEYDVKIDGGAVGAVKDGKLNVKLKYMGLNKIPEATLIVAIKNKDGRLKENILTSSKLTDGVLNCEMTVSGTETDDEMQIYLWNNLDNITPLNNIQRYIAGRVTD